MYDLDFVIKMYYIVRDLYLVTTLSTIATMPATTPAENRVPSDGSVYGRNHYWYSILLRRSQNQSDQNNDHYIHTIRNPPFVLCWIYLL